MHLEYFQMIDRVDDVSDDLSSLSAASSVPAASPVFEGHFPDHPIMPGVLLIETMAQASGFLLMARGGFRRLPFLIGVKDAKLRTFVEPSTPLSIEATLEHDGSGFSVTKAAIVSEGKRICNAQLTFRLAEFPSANLAQLIRSRAREIGMPERYMEAA